MSLYRFEKRLREVFRVQVERAYARVGVLWRENMSEDAQAEIADLLSRLAHQEASNGVPLETLLGRLPLGLSQAIRHALAQSLEADG